MDNERRNHQPNLSINSIASIVEPLTPPDLNEGHVGGFHQPIPPQSSSFIYQQSSSKQLNHSPSGNYGYGGAVSGTNIDIFTPQPSTPSSGMNTGIGGNTFRSRFKSLPLVAELDQKFNQFNITSLQNLSQQTSNNNQRVYYSPSPSLGYNSNNNSSNSIPQIPLNSLQLQNSQSSSSSSSKVPSRHQESFQNKAQGQSFLNKQRFQSLPTIKIQNQQGIAPESISIGASSKGSSVSSTGSAATTSNFKNYDELNLIPIENLDILKLSVDQYGCRYLQKKLEMDGSIKDVIFNKIFNNILDLIVDPFGNYLIQKMADYLTPFQKDLMIEKIHPFLFFISINQYGTRSLQKIIDGISNTYQIDLVVKGLQMNDTADVVDDNNIVKLIKDLNGNHVIQKCIFKFPPEKFQFIIDSICLNNNIVRISTHKHGCCVLQKLLNSANFDQILKISKVLLIYLDDLVNDQFGNYIIQFLFELDFLKTSNEINFLIDEFFNKIFQNLIKLSCLKFSSNVIEKFIKILKIKQNYYYLNEIIKLINFHFETLIKDKFGNYVIQTLIDQFYNVNELKNEMSGLINTVKNYLPIIKAAPYARKIQLKIQQLESSYSLSAASNSITNANNNNGNRQLAFSETSLNNGFDKFQYQHHPIPPTQPSYGSFNAYDYRADPFNNGKFKPYTQPLQPNLQVYSSNEQNRRNHKSFIPQNNGGFANF